jgi:hypothetical protein
MEMQTTMLEESKSPKILKNEQSRHRKSPAHQDTVMAQAISSGIIRNVTWMEKQKENVITFLLTLSEHHHVRKKHSQNVPKLVKYKNVTKTSKKCHVLKKHSHHVRKNMVQRLLIGKTKGKRYQNITVLKKKS